jgi:hypothetical protein
MADLLPPLFDSGNTLVSTNIPHTIVVGTIPTADGKTGILTIRTPDCTLTITMDHVGAAKWADTLAELRDGLAADGLQAGQGLLISESLIGGQG